MKVLHVVLSAMGDGTHRAAVVDSLGKALNEVSSDMTQHGTPLENIHVLEIARVIPLQRQPLVMVAPEPEPVNEVPLVVDWAAAEAAAAQVGPVVAQLDVPAPVVDVSVQPSAESQAPVAPVSGAHDTTSPVGQPVE